MKNLILLLSLALTMGNINNTKAQNLVINEVLAGNSIVNQDENGDYEDWIEIRNNQATSVNLNGFGLSDDPLLPFKWTFPNVSIGAGQYLLIWCSDKNRRVAGSPLHTNFKLSSAGETISITNAGGTVLNTVTTPTLLQNISFGRSPNGTGSFFYFNAVTPGAANGTVSFSETLSPPTFSQASGFFSSGFDLTLSTTVPGATILFTLDGSEPQLSNLGGTTYSYKNQYQELNNTQPLGPFLSQSFRTLQYSTPVTITDRSPEANKISMISTTFAFTPNYLPSTPISKGTVVRAKVVKAGALDSKVETRNYFVFPTGSSRYTLPVMSLSSNENGLFEYNNGISVAGVDFDNWRAANPTSSPLYRSGTGNYYRRGTANERVSNINYLVNGVEALNQDIGIRIHGGTSRATRSKSYSLNAREELGDGDFDFRVFSAIPDNQFTTLIWRNSGGDFDNTMFRDALCHNIVRELNCITENYQPTITFINGEYNGILNLREKYDDKYFEQKFNIASGELDLLVDRGSGSGQAEYGDNVHYQAMLNYMTANSLATTPNYDYIKTQMDVESFSDYHIANIYLQNGDWPGTNIEFWRKRTTSYQPTAPYGQDGRWRWSFHDMDDTFFTYYDDINHNSLADATATNGPSYPNPPWSTFILRSLLASPIYKDEFVNRFADLMNTSFLPSRVIGIMDAMKAVIEPEMPEHIRRWKVPVDMNRWQSNIAEQGDFANQRALYQRNHIRSQFGISSNINATLNVSNYDHGYVKISTIEIKDGTPGISGNPYPWTGIYFSDIPLKLKAIAKPGYVFSNWTGASTSTDAEITITPTANFSITAVFVLDGIVDVSVPIYFWMMDGNIVNGAQLTFLNSTYELATNGVIQYQSCNTGYPTTNAGKSSMERRNNPTTINYRQAVNGNIPYASSDMRGIQIKQPFQSGGLENTMVFNFSTLGYKKIKFSFASVDEGAASAISIDYAVNAGAPVWITTGLAASSLPLTAAYQLFSVDFSTITAVDNNANFKIRLRFTGPNMTADLGARVTFNNIAVDGVKIPLSYASPNVFNVGAAITNLVPSTTQVMTSYSVSPNLPSGLTLNTTTGVISGTPTVAAIASNYTVTGTYASGTETFSLNITVTDGAPTALTYASPNVFTKGTGIADLTPTSSGGAVVSYSVAPALPSGLSIDASTGVISGIPTAVTSIATYTVTATNSGGSTSFGVVITVRDIPPSALSYPSPNTFTRGTAIASLSPTSFGGTVISYSISPSLPTGLFFNTSTGIISGNPAVVRATSTYTVTATNTGGSTTFGVVITVNDVAPSALSYNSPNVFTRGTTISSLNPTVSGGTVTSYSISPALPTGLSFSTSTGRISGTPTVISATATYTVTATNTGGSTTFGVAITVNDVAPSALSYNSPNVYTIGNAISNLNPTISGGAVTSYSIAPALPNGLSFNTATGVISGTPTALSATSTYTVNATNSGGSTTFGVAITVNDVAPSALSYNSPNVFTRGTTIASLNPTVSGGTVNSYSISPALPNGLSFNTATGVISGAPSVISATATYTVTAFNSGGSTSFAIDITINDIAPNTLSYPTPNLFILGTNISSLNPTISGGAVTSYSISPALPNGLSFNITTGVISGTPTAISTSSTYTVTATNTGGSATFGVVITVNDVPPSALSYNSPNVFTRGTTIASLNPTISGGAVTSYSISPALPGGLSFDTATGVISGTPTALSATSTYTVTAFNSGGSTSFAIDITINDIAPNTLSYPTPIIFTVGTAISNLTPTILGDVISYSISPSLPDGLAFDTATGIISGTPTGIVNTTSYTVTAMNSGGSVSFTLSITVNDIAPNSLSYPSPNLFILGTNISSVNPTISGGAVTSYSIVPALPLGLSFNTTTGVISGTPTAISATTTYTVTTTNTGGSTTFEVVITVNDVAPSALSYNSPNVFTRGTTISNLNPTISGGAVTSYSVAPALPNGLSFNTTTGVISGTPTAISASSTYTVTAINTGGSTTFDVVITVNDVAPSALSYNSPNVFNRGTTISSLNPTISGGAVTSYSISPSLPDGLAFDTATGVISGTPSVISATATYTVTAFNSGGSTSFAVDITINDIAPNTLSYPTPNIFIRGTAISDLTPTILGDVISYSISPSLPDGLAFDTATGVISGTPTAISAAASYIVTAFNSGGSVSFTLSITVNDVAPSDLSYLSPNVFTVGTAISDLTPTVLGAVISYSISPSLPDGLAFDTATGAISGTPTTISDTDFYTVTAFNSGGSVTFEIQITVNDVAPSGLSYLSPNVFTVGTAISDLTPTVLGAVISYSISPSLPDGLAFDTATGVISGTPTTISASTSYIVTAFNSGGSVSFEMQIAVNDAAPSGLSYPSPNVFTVGTAISDLTPTVLGAVLSYSISPSLPDGLAFDATTGVISGTPTTISETASYTVTAANLGGSVSFEVIITVEELLSSNENQFKNISIYPNPFLDIINVNGSLLNGTFTVYSVDGKLIQEDSIKGSVINVKHVPSGIYFLKLSNKENRERIFKVIKR